MSAALDNIESWGPGLDGSRTWSEAVPYDDEVSRYRFIWALQSEEVPIAPRVRIAGCQWEVSTAPVLTCWVGNDFDGRWALHVVYRRVTDPRCGAFS